MPQQLPPSRKSSSRLKLIDEPAPLLKAFIAGYRSLRPTVPISTSTARRIDRVVDDLVAGRNVDAIQFEPDTPFASEPGASSCCELFLEFLEQLREHMVAPHVFSISHERALMLLYDYEYELDFEQPFVTLWENDRGHRYLKSTPVFETRFERRVSVRIEVQTDCMDPTIFDRGWADPRADYLTN